MTTTRAYLSSSWTSLVGGLVLLAGAAALVGSIAFWVNGLTVAGSYVTVNVAVQPAAYDPDGSDPDVVVLPARGLPPGSALVVPTDTVSLRAWDSTRGEQALARLDVVVVGVGVAVAAWLLHPVLRGLERGQPFARGNARRMAGIALVIAAVGVLVPVCRGLASSAVLARLDLADPAPVSATTMFDLWPLLVAVLVLAVAEAFRRGEQLHDDVEGLV